MKYYLTVIFQLLVFVFSIRAQLPAYQAQVFGEEYGLGGGSFFDAFVDLQQFVWMTSNSNVQRFDGKSVRKFSFQERITHAICDKDNKIWVIASQSIWRNRPEKDEFERIAFDTSGRNHIRGIFQIQNRPVMLLTTTGLFAWNADSAKFFRLNINLPAPSNRHSILRIDTCAETLFYPVKNGVCAFNLHTAAYRIVPYPLEFHQLFALTPDFGIMLAYGQETYWVDFKTGSLRTVDAQKYGLSKISAKMFLTGCQALGLGRFLVNTRYGLYVYNLNTDQFERKRVFAGGKPISEEFSMMRVFLDANKTAWAVTGTSLVAMRPSVQSIGLLRNYNFETDNQWDNRVYGMTEDDQGNVWFTGFAGFKRLNLETGEIKIYSNKENASDRLAHPSIRGIAWDGKYIILGPTDLGVWLFNPKTEQYRRPVYADETVRKELEVDFIDYIGRMRNGDHLVCGRYNLYRIQAETYKTTILSFPGDKDNMNMVRQDSEGRIWVGTEKGVICLDEHYTFLKNYPLPDIAGVFTIFEEQKNSLLIGTRVGLYRLKTDKAQHYTEHISTAADGYIVCSIFQDSLKRFWITSQNGLYLADQSLGVFKKFDYADNIQSNVFHEGSLVHTKNGLLILGGANGINYFYPERISTADQPLSVSIPAVVVNDGDTVFHFPLKKIELSYRQNTLEFEIAAPYYNNSGKLQYRYRLGGSWIYLGSANHFRLADLSPGAYKLEVAASIGGKIWRQAEVPFVFIVKPPFWQTWWFRIFIFFLLIGSVFLLIRFRENRLRRKQTQQLEIEKLRNQNLQYQLEVEQVVNYFNQSIGNKVVEEALWDVAEQCIAQLGLEDCVIYLVDENKKVLIQKAAWGKKSAPGQRIINPMEIPVGEGIVGNAAAEGRVQLVLDTERDARYIVDDAVRKSELAVPMLIEGKVIGVIDSEHSEKDFFTPWHVQILTAVAALCSNRIALARMEEARRQVWQQLIEKEKSLLEIEKRSAQIRLIALTNHLNPHFLFNSLTSLNSLIFENQQLASDFLQHLSKVYRYLLQHKEKDTVSLKTEIDFVANYVFLLKTRFQSDILIDIEQPSSTVLDKGIVPVTLQILIENAVKHNIISARNPLRIRIETDAHYIKVTNNIQRKKQVETSNRQGLESLRALYSYLSDQALEVLETEQEFTVKLPLIET